MTDTHIIQDGEELLVHAGGQVWAVTWHPPSTAPAGRPHGAAGVCVTANGQVVLISGNGEAWDLPAGRPENGETWEQTLRHEMLEETCGVVQSARLLGFARSECREGSEQGLVLVRSFWRAEIELGAWEPRFEISHRQLVPPEALRSLPISGGYLAVTQRALTEAGVL